MLFQIFWGFSRDFLRINVLEENLIQHKGNDDNYKKTSSKSMFLLFRGAALSVLINQIGTTQDFEPAAPNTWFSGG